MNDGISGAGAQHGEVAGQDNQIHDRFGQATRTLPRSLPVRYTTRMPQHHSMMLPSINLRAVRKTLPEVMLISSPTTAASPLTIIVPQA